MSSQFEQEDLGNEYMDEDIRRIIGQDATDEEVEEYRQDMEAEGRIPTGPPTTEEE